MIWKRQIVSLRWGCETLREHVPLNIAIKCSDSSQIIIIIISEYFNLWKTILLQMHILITSTIKPETFHDRTVDTFSLKKNRDIFSLHGNKVPAEERN